jgi:hypothetical protein
LDLYSCRLGLVFLAKVWPALASSPLARVAASISEPQISPRRGALFHGRPQIWVPDLPAKGVATAVASLVWDFDLRLRRHGGASSGVTVEFGSLYRSWSRSASPAMDQETVGSAQVGGVSARRIWLHASTMSTGCTRSEARWKTRGAAPTDDPQRQRCRLWRPIFEVHKASSAMESRQARGCWFPSSLLLVPAAAASGMGGGRWVSCRDLRVFIVFFLFFEVLCANVWSTFFWSLLVRLYVSCTPAKPGHGKPGPARPENLRPGPCFLARWAGLGSGNAARQLTRAGPG